MDTERLKVTAEVGYLRIRGLVRTGIRFIGVLAVLLAAYNWLFWAPLGGEPFFTVYRSLLPLSGATAGATIIHPADLVLMVVGAIIAWFL
jgi:hypothetical protein